MNRLARTSGTSLALAGALIAVASGEAGAETSPSAGNTADPSAFPGLPALPAIHLSGSTVISSDGVDLGVGEDNAGIAYQGLDFVDAPHYDVDTSTGTAQVAYPFHFNSGTIVVTGSGQTVRLPLPPLAGNPGVTVSRKGVVPTLGLG